MKIHIVQKGDTLWELAKKYNVDFEELKQANSHLSSPDMIMPGMKIKIPSTTKPVKKQMMKDQQKQMVKDHQKTDTKHLYKDTTPKAMPIIQEDDKKEMQPVQPLQPQPMMPQMPMMPFPEPAKKKWEKPQTPNVKSVKKQINHYTTINLPKMPEIPKAKQKPTEVPDNVKQKEYSQPAKKGKPKDYSPLPHKQPYEQQPAYPYMPECVELMYQPMPQMMPMYYPYFQHPCPPVPCPPMPFVDPMMYQPQPVPPTTIGTSDCGCGGPQMVSPYPDPHSHTGTNPYYAEPVTNMPKLQTNLSMPSFGGYHEAYRNDATDEGESEQFSSDAQQDVTDRE